MFSWKFFEFFFLIVFLKIGTKGFAFWRDKDFVFGTFGAQNVHPFQNSFCLGKVFAVNISWPCTEAMMFLLILDLVLVHCRANLSMSIAVCLDVCADFFILGGKRGYSWGNLDLEHL